MKYIVTTPTDFKSSQPREVPADSRLEALSNLGFTVWTEEEWEQAPTEFKDKVVKWPFA